jgi:methyl coenzyme M reductase gamma subunit
MTFSLNLFAASAQLGQNDVNTTLVDATHAFGRNAQTHETVLRLDPEAVMLQVRQETTTGFVVCVGNVIPGYRTLTGNLTDSRHASAL